MEKEEKVNIQCKIKKNYQKVVFSLIFFIINAKYLLKLIKNNHIINVVLKLNNKGRILWKRKVKTTKQQVLTK